MKIFQHAAEYNLYDTLRTLSYAPQGWHLVHLEHNIPRDASQAPWHARVMQAVEEGAFADMRGAAFILDDGDVVLVCHAPVARIGAALGGQVAELGTHALHRIIGIMSSRRRGCYAYDLSKACREAMLLVSVKRSAYVRAHAAA